MAPGDVAHVPRTPSPVAGAGPIAKHFRSRARLRRLLVRLRRPTPSTPALRATPGGASLTTFGFVTTVPRYLLEASNPLTFVRGACRAYCAPRKCHCGLIYAPRKGYADRPMLCLYWLPAPPREGHWRAHSAAAPCRRTPPGGALAGALGSGTLPPAAVLCRRTYARTSEIPVFPPKTNCILQSPVYINNSVVTGRSPANSVNRKSSKSL